MPLLQVKDVPFELYDKISKMAKMENRRFDEEILILLETGINLSTREIRLRHIFKEIDKLDLGNTNSFPSPEEMIREDRDR
jgi:hypothetical protein